MILVDDQAGSKDLYPYIHAIAPDSVMTRIECGYGDMAWVGEGPDNTNLSVGVEYKQIEDVLACIKDGRFVGQCRGMVEHYDRRYLLVEGRVRADRTTGLMQKLRRDRWYDLSITYRDLEHWYTTIEEQAQFRVVKTFDEYESAQWIKAKHSWYVAKGWDEHKSLKQFHVPPPPTATFVRPSFLRRVAKELIGVGWEKSMAVEARFRSVREMINANEQTWMEIAGIGKTMAKRIVEEITFTRK